MDIPDNVLKAYAEAKGWSSDLGVTRLNFAAQEILKEAKAWKALKHAEIARKSTFDTVYNDPNIFT